MPGVVVITGNLVVIMKVKVTQLCPTVCDPMDYTVHGILQARFQQYVNLELPNVQAGFKKSRGIR